MLQTETLAFLCDLKDHNSKTWLDANRPAYENAKRAFAELVESLWLGLSQLDPAVANSGLTPKDCLFSLNRDVRFSTDKSPYRTAFTAWLSQGGKKSPAAGFYLNIEPGNNSYLAAGVFTPETPVVNAIRRASDANPGELLAMLADPALSTGWGPVVTEGGLQKVPKGYDPEHRAAAYLKLKSWLLRSPLTDQQVCNRGLLDHLFRLMELGTPWIQFLNRAILVPAQ